MLIHIFINWTIIIDYFIKRYKNERFKCMDGRNRNNISIGLEVFIVEKKNQKTGTLTFGKISKILTNSKFHSNGIKVVTEEGSVGRVKIIVDLDKPL